MRKQQPSPMVATTPPAIAGPTSRVALKFEELSAMALLRSARLSIIRTTNAWRVGISTALIRPWNSASPTIHGMVM